MSKQQRKGRNHGHNRQSSGRAPLTSDYESDTFAGQNNHATEGSYAPPPPTRTNTQLNLAVLRRYLPSINSINSIAANAVLYTFNEEGKWDKSGVEGTMFTCTQDPLPTDPLQRARACLFILNRRGLSNLVIDLGEVQDIEVSGELTILTVGEEWQGQGDKTLGVWLHNDESQTRSINQEAMRTIWEYVRANGPVGKGEVEAGAATQAIGGSGLSVHDLFKAQGAAQGVQ
ncbi:uncharacterized protein J7T54_002505 [Emericellopsis cladophorae]|uniref:Uncharacterized protein n=1 Tax=Emericellopsis cladophorae TaxID=2686198 RepID=A0A9P9Y076_9HYPO|nr:uncharacterized protein J7T54_002505 [Emericellopsis cladophorae]KAI6781149.1 hypothetical protein J7T54_002505 [Emericellopsis cladophorae]